MIDNDVVEVARSCAESKGNVCGVCPYGSLADCESVLLGLLVNIIDEKDKRIEELEERLAIMTEGVES